MNNDTLKWRLSPQLHDGEHSGVVKTEAEVETAIQTWFENCPQDGSCIGEGFSVVAIDMSDEEYDAIPEDYPIQEATEIGLRVLKHQDPPLFSVHRADGSRLFDDRDFERVRAYLIGFRDGTKS